jgi:hypothetical protein
MHAVVPRRGSLLLTGFDAAIEPGPFLANGATTGLDGLVLPQRWLSFGQLFRHNRNARRDH